MTFFFFFFKQKTAYEMRISDWSSDVCSSDLFRPVLHPVRADGGDRRADEPGGGANDHAACGRLFPEGRWNPRTWRGSVDGPVHGAAQMDTGQPLEDDRPWRRLAGADGRAVRNPASNLPADDRDRKSTRLNYSH